MADEVTVEGLQEQLKASQTALEEASKGQMSKDDLDRLTFLEGENKTLIGARDKAKDDRRLADEKLLAEQGEFKTLAEQLQSQLDEKTGDIASRDERLAKYQERDEVEFKELLENVPEAFKALVSDESLPLANRLQLAKAHVGVKTQTPGYRPPGEQGSETLQEQLTAAIKDGNVMAQISLKRQMAEKK
jgi:hypothetical protein